MSERLTTQQLRDLALIADQPARTRVERNFGLPSGLYVATVGLYVAFIGLMAALFLNPQLAIPLAVIGGFIVFAFALAGAWTKMKPDHDDKPMSWGQLSNRGIETLSGRLTANEAAIQVLMLPALILVWGFAIAVIVALT